MLHLASVLVGMIIGCFIQRNRYVGLLDITEQRLTFAIKKSNNPDHINEALMIIDFIRSKATGRKFQAERWLFKNPLNICPYDLTIGYYESKGPQG